MKIEEQKVVAKKVLEKIKIVDPYALLAGGAPRDWYFGNPCNDLDIYYYSNTMTIHDSIVQLNSIFPDTEFHRVGRKGCSTGKSDRENYSTMPFMKDVFEGNIDGMRVQFIKLKENGKQFDVVNSMDVSICKCYYDHVKDKIVLTNDFKITIASKVMFLSNECKWYDKHPSKMVKRFSEFKTGTKDIAIDTIVKDAIKNIK